MNAYRNYRNKGFTLVEILIVVIILGILAAIVIPQFSNASEDARKNSASSLIQTVRSAVELYRLEHAGLYPTSDGDIASAWDWAKLTNKTNVGGTVGSAAEHKYGPYLQQTPKNPINGLDNVVLDGAAAATTGFSWDSGLGRMSIVAKDDAGTYVLQ